MNKLKNFPGVTYIEVITVVGLMALIFGMGFFFINANKSKSILVDTSIKVVDQLRYAQKMSAAGQKNGYYGIYFSNTYFELFNGKDYQNKLGNDDMFTLGGAVEFFDLNLNGGGNEIVFKSPFGKTQNFGSFKIREKGAKSFYLVEVSKTGSVQSQWNEE